MYVLIPAQKNCFTSTNRYWSGQINNLFAKLKFFARFLLQGSLQGGIPLTISGDGFFKSLTQVILGPSSYTSNTLNTNMTYSSIVLTTKASNLEATYTLQVYVNGIAAICDPSVCAFTYATAHLTPHIQSISPLLSFLPYTCVLANLHLGNQYVNVYVEGKL